MKTSRVSGGAFIDPVCLLIVEPSGKKIAWTHEMRTYHFCAEKCRDAFKADPDRYLELTAPGRKGWWGRYLDRLNKATGGKPPTCCR